MLTGTAFTVQWEKVVLQDKPTSGDFTFQATLHSNGDIIFVYQNVPVVIKNIEDDLHPVKVGLSDAYIIDRTIFCKLYVAMGICLCSICDELRSELPPSISYRHVDMKVYLNWSVSCGEI